MEVFLLHQTQLIELLQMMSSEARTGKPQTLLDIPCPSPLHPQHVQVHPKSVVLTSYLLLQLLRQLDHLKIDLSQT